MLYFRWFIECLCFKGLFHRAIAESGSALCDWAYIEGSVARERATLVAKNLGCNTDNATIIVSCLSKMSTTALCQASVNNVMSIQVKNSYFHHQLVTNRVKSSCE